MELTLENLRKDFGPHRAVAGVSAVLRPGVYGLLGANGAGKTTLLRMLCGVLRPTAGQIRLDGAPITSLGADYRARLGYLPQEFGGYPNYTARAFLLYMAALKGLRRDEALPQIDKLLRLVGLQEAGRTRLGSYSGGMRRRCWVSRTFWYWTSRRPALTPRSGYTSATCWPNTPPGGSCCFPPILWGIWKRLPTRSF